MRLLIKINGFLYRDLFSSTSTRTYYYIFEFLLFSSFSSAFRRLFGRLRFCHSTIRRDLSVCLVAAFSSFSVCRLGARSNAVRSLLFCLIVAKRREEKKHAIKKAKLVSIFRSRLFFVLIGLAAQFLFDRVVRGEILAFSMVTDGLYV